jgi:hypothetical protein
VKPSDEKYEPTTKINKKVIRNIIKGIELYYHKKTQKVQEMNKQIIIKYR